MSVVPSAELRRLIARSAELAAEAEQLEGPIATAAALRAHRRRLNVHLRDLSDFARRVHDEGMKRLRSR